MSAEARMSADHTDRATLCLFRFLLSTTLRRKPAQCDAHVYSSVSRMLACGWGSWCGSLSRTCFDIMYPAH